MRNLLLTSTAAVVLCLAGAVSAADLPSRRAPTAYVPPTFSWTGFYAGVNAGYAFSGDSSIKNIDVIYYGDTIGPLDSERKSDEGSFTGGAQVGYNYQIGNFVIGAEADFNYADVNVDYNGRSDFIAIETPLVGRIDGAYDVSARSKVEWFGTVRARAGFTPIDRLLVFATAGLAYGSVKTNMSFTDYFGGAVDGQFSGSKSDTRFGWTLGAGAEYAITNNLTLKGEYAYVDLGDKRHTWSYTTTDLVGRVDSHSMTATDEAKFHIIRAGLNYKF